jgi:hypothetical protein
MDQTDNYEPLTGDQLEAARLRAEDLAALIQQTFDAILETKDASDVTYFARSDAQYFTGIWLTEYLKGGQRT